MDKTKYSDGVIIITCAFMAFCWAGKALLPLQDMVVCGLSGILLGLFTELTEKYTKAPVYVCRGAGAFAAALFIIEVSVQTNFIATDAITVIASMIPPMAAGAMLVEGMCTAKAESGRKKIINAILISIFLAAGVKLAVVVEGLRGISV